MNLYCVCKHVQHSILYIYMYIYVGSTHSQLHNVCTFACNVVQIHIRVCNVRYIQGVYVYAICYANIHVHV